VAHRLERRVADEMRDALLAAGQEIVDAQDVVTLPQQALAKMRAQEAGAAGHQNAARSQAFRHPLLTDDDCRACAKRVPAGRSWLSNCFY